MKAPETLIASHPFWEGLTVRCFPELAEASTRTLYEADRVIFREGNPADGLFLICTGRVALETAVPGQGYATIQTVGPGEVVGFSWLYPPYRWQFGARTLEASELIRLDGGKVRQLMEDDPVFGREMAMRVGQIILQRLQATRLQLMDFYGCGD